MDAIAFWLYGNHDSNNKVEDKDGRQVRTLSLLGRICDIISPYAFELNRDEFQHPLVPREQLGTNRVMKSMILFVKEKLRFSSSRSPKTRF